MAWIGGGVLLIAAPLMASEPARRWIVVTLACVFAFGALGNAWATRGRHFGWMVFSAVVAMAAAGYQRLNPPLQLPAATVIDPSHSLERL